MASPPSMPQVDTLLQPQQALSFLKSLYNAEPFFHVFFAPNDLQQNSGAVKKNEARSPSLYHVNTQRRFVKSSSSYQDTEWRVWSGGGLQRARGRPRPAPPCKAATSPAARTFVTGSSAFHLWPGRSRFCLIKSSSSWVVKMQPCRLQLAGALPAGTEPRGAFSTPSARGTDHTMGQQALQIGPKAQQRTNQRPLSAEAME